MANIKIDYKAKKYFGQNFLSDNTVLKRIASFANLDKETTVIEIGPGLGSLTKELLKDSKKVIAYEIDKDIIPKLENNLKDFDNLEIIEKDILKADLSYICSLDGKVILVSNLPYNITSPVISLFLEKLNNVDKAIFMVQKEVQERLCAKVSTKDYNAFTILVNYYATVKKLLDVNRTCFKPVPNVDSAVIELDKRETKIKSKNEIFFEKIVEVCFKERRKTLLNNLCVFLKTSKEETIVLLEKLDIDPLKRAETLSIDDFILLSNKLEAVYESKR